MAKALDDLKGRMGAVHDLAMTSAVLGWDQRVFMPTGGAEARARQLGTLARLGHEILVSQETQEILGRAEEEGKREGWTVEDDHGALLRVARRDWEKAAKVPTRLVVELTEATALGEQAWVAARKESNYAQFAPWLEKILGLKREYARVMGYKEGGRARMYDFLLDDFEEGATGEMIDQVFGELKRETVPLVGAIAAHQDRASAEVLRRGYDEGLQERFSRKVVTECGYHFGRGRLDRTVHPFCTNFSINDVRITTRFDTKWLPAALFGCLHEMGHALYEMGIKPAYEGTVLAGGVSLGVHESQSRLWENMVGRSRGFWEHYYPELQRTFPGQLGGVKGAEFYQAINCVHPSLIRVEADEVTYNLHVILRYEMENELLAGRLSVAEAPAAWNAKMKAYLGIDVPNDREGILQDVHWSGGGIGYFPTYTLGNILAAQFFAAAVRDRPEIPEEIGRGEFGGMLGWLQEKVHQYGRKFPPRELVKRATGRELTIEPYVGYLKRKFGEVYGV